VWPVKSNSLSEINVNRQILATLAIASFTPAAIAAIAEPAGISAALRAPDGEEAQFVLQAQGVQIYACKPRADDAYAYQWAFVAPEATLTEGGASVGTHGAGPTWTSASDRSSAKGAVKQRQGGGAGYIPWLLLSATSTEGAGKFAGVTSVQRVATRGGVEPAEACDASKSGREARVPYTADYYFYKRK
jgi:hypothetical protein